MLPVASSVRALSNPSRVNTETASSSSSSAAAAAAAVPVAAMSSAKEEPLRLDDDPQAFPLDHYRGKSKMLSYGAGRCRTGSVGTGRDGAVHVQSIFVRTWKGVAAGR